MGILYCQNRTVSLQFSKNGCKIGSILHHTHYIKQKISPMGGIYLASKTMVDSSARGRALTQTV